jgi:hypothetical protein
MINNSFAGLLLNKIKSVLEYQFIARTINQINFKLLLIGNCCKSQECGLL